MEKAVRERRKAFPPAHGSDEKRQVYISVSQYASSIISEAMAETWQKECSSIFPIFDPKSVHSILRSIANSASYSSPNFPNCPFPMKTPSAYANYLKFHFSVFQQKGLRSKARGYLSELR